MQTVFCTVICNLTVTATVAACLREPGAVSNPGLTSFTVLCVNWRGEKRRLGNERGYSSHQWPRKHPYHLLPELPTQISSARPTRPRRCRSSSRPHLACSRRSPLKAAQQARGRFAWGVWLLSRAEVRASSALGSSRRGLGDKGARSRRCRVHPGPSGQTRKSARRREAGGRLLAGEPKATGAQSRRGKGRRRTRPSAAFPRRLSRPPSPAATAAPQPEQRPRLSRGQWRLLPRLRPGRAAGSAGSWSFRRALPASGNCATMTAAWAAPPRTALLGRGKDHSGSCVEAGGRVDFVVPAPDHPPPPPPPTAKGPG
ncbi:uncharacterized protein LOC117092096 [Trachypithecus francoisi]|uniref:uncharacterized protein LOC117092096 n=1 Tax=Trachypithecus francoisi TaxID=54180 RepID=UPI00141AAA01|nr:uncharacterized protein LOC117092096 [Trachypithecus francoisi]